ncbi:hypothetical protein Aperf_G00000060524 [Anoplocephala perfoliata]
MIYRYKLPLTLLYSLIGQCWTNEMHPVSTVQIALCAKVCLSINRKSSMKSGGEFGILRRELTSTTPQQTLRRKVTTHDLVLNNEECVSSGTFQGQGHYYFTEVAENVPRKPFVSMAKVPAFELMEAPGKTTSALASQSVGMMAISKPQAPTHVIALPPQTHQFKMDPMVSNSELFQRKKGRISRRKWLM